MAKNFMVAVEDRRTYYNISKEATISDERIQEILRHAVRHTPSAFNSQSARVVLLLGDQHNKLWDITKETLRRIVPSDHFASTEEKLDSFRSGYATVLFFEDQSIIRSLQEQFPRYAENFPGWSLQSSGMHQFVIWTALEIEGFGVSLQHYNPLIDDSVKSEWGISDDWKLLAQMPFGKPTAGPANKEFKPLEERIKIFK
jgi:predicted oxidoreductase (fatty acid repression mutant protein)